MSEEYEIVNAIVESASIDDGERGLLTAWLYLDYGGSVQGFGGYALYLPKDYKYHEKESNYAGHFIWRCMAVAGVSSWEAIKGKTIRVRRSKNFGGAVYAIGHIVKDDWFCPSEDFKNQANN